MVVWAAITWAGLAGLYLLLAGDFSEAEFTICIICASVGTIMAIALARASHRRFAGWPKPRSILRPLAALIPEALAVGRQYLAAIFTFKEQRGAYVRQGFDPGGDDPVSAGRRAAVVLGISLAPGSFVIRGDLTDTLILHALPPKSASSDQIWPA